MPRSKAKQQQLDLRNQTYEIRETCICMTCKHWLSPFSRINGTCWPRHLQFRDRVDHTKETPANGTCDLWQAKEGE